MICVFAFVYAFVCVRVSAYVPRFFICTKSFDILRAEFFSRVIPSHIKWWYLDAVFISVCLGFIYYFYISYTQLLFINWKIGVINEEQAETKRLSSHRVTRSGMKQNEEFHLHASKMYCTHMELKQWNERKNQIICHNNHTNLIPLLKVFG